MNAKPVKELKIYQMMVDLLHAEKKCTERIRDSEEEVDKNFVTNKISFLLSILSKINKIFTFLDQFHFQIAIFVTYVVRCCCFYFYPQ